MSKKNIRAPDVFIQWLDGVAKETGKPKTEIMALIPPMFSVKIEKKKKEFPLEY